MRPENQRAHLSASPLPLNCETTALNRDATLYSAFTMVSGAVTTVLNDVSTGCEEVSTSPSATRMTTGFIVTRMTGTGLAICRGRAPNDCHLHCTRILPGVMHHVVRDEALRLVVV